MRTQKEIENRVLGYLYDAANKGQTQVPEETVVEWLGKKNISKIRVEHALDVLSECELIEARTGNTIRANVSDYGNDVRVDCAYRITLSGIENFERQKHENAERYKQDLSERRRPVLSDDNDKSDRAIPDINWNKWAAIAALIAIPVALFTWWFS